MNRDVRLQAKILLSGNVARLFMVSFCGFILRYGTLILSGWGIYHFYKSPLFFYLLGTYNEYFVYAFSFFGACLLIFFSFLFICSIRSGEYFVYFTCANGGYAKFSSLFKFLNIKKAVKFLSLYIQINTRKILWLFFFFMPSAICFACIYFLQHNSFLQESVYITLYCGASATLALAYFMSRFYALRISAAPYYICLNQASPSAAIKKSIHFTDGSLCDGTVLECSLIGWILSCLFLIPALYAIPYIKLTKAVFITNAVHLKSRAKSSYAINILGLA